MIYAGTYTRGSGGIHRIGMADGTGALSGGEVAAECPSPSFLAVGPGGKALYAVNEIGDYAGARAGSVSAFARGADGALKPVNVVSSHGSYPCHLTVTRAGGHVLVANYGSGAVAVIPVLSDGSLGDASCVIQHHGSSVNQARQEGPHAHSVDLDRANRFALVCDLGIDQTLIYRFDASGGKLLPHDTVHAARGAGPRHVAFHPNGRLVYVINELDSTIGAYRYDPAAGAMKHIDTISTLPADFKGASTTAEIAVHPSGRWVYGSNRGHDSLAIFAVNPATGALRPVGHAPTLGKTPRHFSIHPGGRFVLVGNQESDAVLVFRIDGANGSLAPAESRVSIPSPVCVLQC